MLPVRPLPTYLAKRYHGWKATDFNEHKAWYSRLAVEGQRPRAMVISCCDSRVHVTSIFGAETGEFFIHRNIANLVPPFEPNSDHHGTSAAIEYAVTGLKVSNIIVMGHSLCGGVQACNDMCSGNAPDLEETASFVGRWMDILRPGYDRVNARNVEPEKFLGALEREGVVVSIENLLTFPFIKDRVDAGELALHGLWNNIATGELEGYDAETATFQPI